MNGVLMEAISPNTDKNTEMWWAVPTLRNETKTWWVVPSLRKCRREKGGASRTHPTNLVKRKGAKT